MRTLLLAFMAMLSTYAMEGVWFPSDHWADVYQRVYLENLVKVKLADGFCTGEVVSPGHVLTAWHCLADGTSKGEVLDQFDRSYPFDQVSYDAPGDLALLVVTVPNKKPITLAKSEPYPTEPVMAIGFGMFFDSVKPSIVVGQIVGHTDVHTVVDHLFLHGFSGGPLVNEDGELVGINLANLNHQGVGLSAPLSTIKDFLGVHE